MKDSKTYIIILNYNGWKDTIECAESVLRSTDENYQIIIVDNCSKNESFKQIKHWLEGNLVIQAERNLFNKKLDVTNSKRREYREYHYLKEKKFNKNFLCKDETGNFPIILIQTGKNLGFAGGNNAALDILLGLEDNAFVFLLNPDTFLDKNALMHLTSKNKVFDEFLSGMFIYNYYNEHELLSIGGTRIIKPLGVVRDIRDIKDLNKIDYIYGGALFTTIKTIRKIGLMPDFYFLYWEETDWCFNAKNQGIPLKINQKAFCYDKVGTSVGRGYLSEYFYSLNALRFFKKNFPQYFVPVFCFMFVRIFVKLIKGKFEQSKAIFEAIKNFIIKKFEYQKD